MLICLLENKYSILFYSTLPQLRREIARAWREVDAGKERCPRLIKSMPKWAAAGITKKGAQVQKADYH